MQIGNDKVVTIDYTLTDPTGKVLDQSGNGEFAYLHGAGNIIPGLEEALTGKQAGDGVSVALDPEQAYGMRDPAKVEAVPRNLFPEGTEIQVGMQFHAEGPQGQTLMVTVVEVADDRVTVDGNHPLAGVALNFEVQVVEVRDASPEEIDQGHLQGPDGQEH